MMQYFKRINRSIECISLILAVIRLSPRTVLGLLLHVYWVIMQYFKRFSRSIECISLILHTTHTLTVLPCTCQRSAEESKDGRCDGLSCVPHTVNLFCMLTNTPFRAVQQLIPRSWWEMRTRQHIPITLNFSALRCTVVILSKPQT